ncbi:hypothetical protein SRHO_G00197030 [Serrasalmus rhombeus]
MLQVLEAACQCCRRGVLHRDIKTENLLINTDTSEVKLIDFGCGDWIRKTGYNEFAGTLEYHPLEFLLKGKYHAKPATVWSLSVPTVQHCFTMDSIFITSDDYLFPVIQ